MGESCHVHCYVRGFSGVGVKLVNIAMSQLCMRIVLLCCCAYCAAVVQETKLQESHVEEVIKQVGLQGWHVTFNCSTAKKGYSGTATLCR